jgi:hypothetical protein
MTEISEPTGPRADRRNFGDDPVCYYREHYEGVTRGQLRKRDPSLYERLRREGLLEAVPGKESRFGDDPVAYYREHYEGLTRGELAKQDPTLYQRLRHDGLLGEVPKRCLGRQAGSV